jgi:hypothetical protein
VLVVAGDAVRIALVSTQNSLLTGNFTGNSEESDHEETALRQQTPEQRVFLLQFPSQGNRESLSKSREFARINKEYLRGKQGALRLQSFSGY